MAQVQKWHVQPVPAGAAVHARSMVTVRITRAVAQPAVASQWMGGSEVSEWSTGGEGGGVGQGGRSRDLPK
jgi:hypothetical protein